MSDQLTLDYCIGKGNDGESYKTNWYGFDSVPVSQDTRCEYCYRHIMMWRKIRPVSMFPIAQTSLGVDCDNIRRDPDLTTLKFGEFEFRVVSPDLMRPFLKHPRIHPGDHPASLHLELPMRSKFTVVISPCDSWKSIPNNYFSVGKMQIGEKKVHINDGQPTYYHDRLAIGGYSPTESFEFIADGETPDEYEAKPENIININIQTYKHNGDDFIWHNSHDVSIQLGYVGPDWYRVPQNYESFRSLETRADSFYDTYSPYQNSNNWQYHSE